jgi:DNA invertase Pin-like site-specific DNA recombinase
MAMDRKRPHGRAKQVAIARLGEVSKPGIPSDYIHDLHALLGERPDLREVILYCRCSASAQGANGNLDDQIAACRGELERLGLDVIAAFGEISSGWLIDMFERDQFVAACRLAAKRKTIVVAESVDRFLRHSGFNTHERKDAIPTAAEFEKLQQLAGDVTLATLLHPDTPPSRIRSHQRKRGQAIKGRCGGRPKKQRPYAKWRRRQELMPLIRSLRASGLSMRQVAASTDVPHSTVRRWLGDD